MAGTRELRMAVLKLAAAHPEDRQWILSRLPTVDRPRIETLLRELAQLGIDDYRPWIRELEVREPETGRTAATTVAPAPAAATDLRHATWAGWLLTRPDALSMTEQLRLEDMADAQPAAELPALPPAMAAALKPLLLNGSTPA